MPSILTIKSPVIIIFNSTHFLLAFLCTFSSMGSAPSKPVPINSVLHFHGISSLSVRGVCPLFYLNSFEAFFFLFSILPLFITISLEYSLSSFFQAYFCNLIMIILCRFNCSYNFLSNYV